MRSSYEYNWRWGVVIAWSGIKGVFSLLMAPEIYNMAENKSVSPYTVGKVMSHDYSHLFIFIYFVALVMVPNNKVNPF